MGPKLLIVRAVRRQEVLRQCEADVVQLGCRDICTGAMDCNFNKASDGGDWEVGRVGGSGPSNAPYLPPPSSKSDGPQFGV